MESNNKHYTTTYESKQDYIWTIIGIIVIGMFIGVALACVAYIGSASAEVDGEMYVICQPDSFLNIRESPKKTARESGRLELGDRIETDGKLKNGYMHIVNASTESGDGWVAVRYLVTDRPEIVTETARNISGGRAAIRKYPGGKRTGWLKKGATVTVYAWTDEWCVTNRGFISSDCLESD